MRKLLLSLFLLPFVAFSQTERSAALENLFKLEAGFQGFNVGYELPLSKKLLLNADGGVGPAIKVYDNLYDGSGIQMVAAEHNKVYVSPFLRAGLRLYVNRERRAQKEHSLVNNAGSFIGFQSKFVFNAKSFGNTLATDLHFGQQLPIGSNFIIRYHAGIGLGINVENSAATPYPALGASFGYVF